MNEKQSFLKQIASSFLEVEKDIISINKKELESKGVNVNKENVIQQPNLVNNIPQKSCTTPVNESFTTNHQEIDTQKFTKHFDELMNQLNLPGPDYYEFEKIYNEFISNNGMNDVQAMQNAYTALKFSGLTKESLLESGQHYLNAFNNDKVKFEETLNNLTKTEINSKELTIVESETKISELQKQLDIEIIKLSETRIKLEEAKVKLVANKQGYEIAVNMKIQSLINNINKITNYIN